MNELTLSKILRPVLYAATLAFVAVPAGPVWAKEKPELAIKDKGAMQGATQVAVVAFNVGFIFESIDATAATGGLMGAFGGTTKAKSALVGVTPEMMQQITDAAYNDFIARLGAAGLTVADPAVVFADAGFAKVKGVDSPVDINIALEKGSKGKATYYKPSLLAQQIMVPGDFVGSGMSSLGLNMAAGQNLGHLGSYAKAAGMPVIDVTYLIDFSDQKRPGAFSFGGLKVNANLSVVPTYSRTTVIGANGKSNTITVGRPVAVEGEFIEVADASSGTDKAVQSAANVAGGAAAAIGLGGLRFGKTRKFEFIAKKGVYEEGATKAASLANEKVVGALIAGR